MVLELDCGYGYNFLLFKRLILVYNAFCAVRKSEMSLYKLLFWACALVFLTGCSNPQAKQIDKICLPGLTITKAMELSEGVLRDFNFAVNKEDPNTGYISTRPLPGGQFFEFWRKDNVGSYNQLQSSIQSIRRTVELKMDEQAGSLCVACNVKLERLSLSEPPEEVRGLQFDRFTGRRIRTAAMKMELEPGQAAWVDLGTDTILESVILERIERASKKLKN